MAHKGRLWPISQIHRIYPYNLYPDYPALVNHVIVPGFVRGTGGGGYVPEPGIPGGNITGDYVDIPPWDGTWSYRATFPNTLGVHCEAGYEFRHDNAAQLQFIGGQVWIDGVAQRTGHMLGTQLSSWTTLILPFFPLPDAGMVCFVGFLGIEAKPW
jgi:hypothetical protein